MPLLERKKTSVDIPQKLKKVRAEIIRLTQIPENERDDEWENRLRAEYTISLYLRLGEEPPKKLEVFEGEIILPIVDEENNANIFVLEPRFV